MGIIKHNEILCYLMIFLMIIMMILHMDGKIMLFDRIVVIPTYDFYYFISLQSCYT